MTQILQKHPTWSAILFGCTISIIICVLFGRGDFNYAFASVIIVLLGGVLLPLSGLFERLSRQQDLPLMGALHPIIRTTSILFICQIVSLPLGYYLYRSDLENAQHFLGELIPQLEEYKEREGQYPYSIRPITQQMGQREPYLLRNQDIYYQGYKRAFNFCIVETGRMAIILIYYSETDEWRSLSTLSSPLMGGCSVTIRPDLRDLRTDSEDN